MAEHIKRASFWTLKSLFFLSNKIITFIFAIFCAVTGQVKNNSAQQDRVSDTIVVSGQVFSAADSSSFIDNIKVVLYETTNTWYGMPNDPAYDTTKISGIFDIEFPSSLYDYGMEQFLIATDIDGKENGQFKTCTLRVNLNHVEEDTTVNIYMVPEEVAKLLTENQKIKSMQIKKSDIVTININSLGKHSKQSAKIYSIAGQMIEELSIGENGTVKWNTTSIAKGSYIIKVPIADKIVSTKLILK